MLFIGYPITYQTAAKLIGLDPKTDHEIIAERYLDFKLGLNYIYRDTCGLGLIVHELSVPDNNFKPCYEGLEIIKSYSHVLADRLQQASIDLTTLEIVPSRDHPPVTKTNPKPYLIVI